MLSTRASGSVTDHITVDEERFSINGQAVSVRLKRDPNKLRWQSYVQIVPSMQESGGTDTHGGKVKKSNEIPESLLFMTLSCEDMIGVRYDANEPKGKNNKRIGLILDSYPRVKPLYCEADYGDGCSTVKAGMCGCCGGGNSIPTDDTDGKNMSKNNTDGLCKCNKKVIPGHRSHHRVTLHHMDPAILLKWYNLLIDVVCPLPDRDTHEEHKDDADNIDNEKRQIKMRKILVLINPASGKGLAKNVWQQVKPVFHHASDACITLVYTMDVGHGYRIVTDKSNGGDDDDYIYQFQSIVIISGDGLMSEAVNGIMHRKDWKKAVQNIVFGIVPAGSGNGLAKSVSMTSGDEFCTIHIRPINAAFVVAKGRRLWMDIYTVAQDREQTLHRTELMARDPMHGLLPKDKEKNDKLLQKEAKEAGGKKKEIIIGVTLEDMPGFFPPPIKENKEHTIKPFYGFLSLGWAIIADCDFESEKYRRFGSARFTISAVTRLLFTRLYSAYISYVLAEEHANVNADDKSSSSSSSAHKKTAISDDTEVYTMDDLETFNEVYSLAYHYGVDDEKYKNSEAVKNWTAKMESEKWSNEPVRQNGQVVKATKDGEDPALLSMIMLWCMNLSWPAHDMHSAPLGCFNDGCLDLNMCQAAPKTALAKLFLNFESGGHVESPHIVYKKVKAVKLIPGDGRKCVISVDGEKMPCQASTMRVFNKIIQIYCKPEDGTEAYGFYH